MYYVIARIPDKSTNACGLIGGRQCMTRLRPAANSLQQQPLTENRDVIRLNFVTKTFGIALLCAEFHRIDTVIGILSVASREATASCIAFLET